ncbi:3'-5' exonuclease [Amycolatopsis suaedae]|uniref:DNA 3'-5' helicase n=1 Tax=Amycolatopsis suaedae TaxID=2510978 RepID=A0A4Q7J852_9PSEU|nr:3'-5' exonuclease [Amycolatopsis suaedae]RZQ63389.1 ATP-dependent helicase [Amycolatopsis suaedae]
MGARLPEPQGQQREVVYLRAQGHCVALGVAGSGKTVMAVRRAHYLATAPGFGGPTLLVTFNGALTTYLRSIVDDHPNITVEQYHVLARRLLVEQFGVKLRICDNQTRDKLIALALDDVHSRGHYKRAASSKPVSFYSDEFDWLIGNAITDFDAYINGKIERVGRGRGPHLRVADRQLVCDVYRRYQQIRRSRGFDQDWPGISNELRRAVSLSPNPAIYRHVIIDEGQDFSPDMIRSLASIVSSKGSVTFFGDYAQQIYGSRMSWKSLGLKIGGGKVVKFDRNYRNTRPIAHFAKFISETPLFSEGIDLVEPKDPPINGPEPVLVRARSADDQVAQAARFANNLARDRRTRLANQRVVVLIRDKTAEEDLVGLLDHPRTIRLHKGMSKWDERPGIFYGPHSEARGLEFDAVIVPFCDDSGLPTPSSVDAFGLEEARIRQARELYVAVTRARTDLVLIHSSKLTRFLPDERSGLYFRIDP